MKTILVTGCSGYIGTYLCKMLAGKYIVHGLDTKHPSTSLDKFYRQSITGIDTSDMPSYYDAIVHLAAYVSGTQSAYNPALCYSANVTGTINLLDKIKTKNIIFASSGQVSSNANPFSVSKRAGEDCVLELCRKNSEIKYTIFRMYNVLGGNDIKFGDKDGLMSYLIRAKETGEFMIHGDDCDTPDGSCIRDYVHVHEVCNAFITAIEQPAQGIEHLGYGVGRSVKEMVKLFKTVNQINFNVTLGARLLGEQEVVVAEKPSRYLQQIYKIEDCLKL